jgi:hypothetical protein
MNPVVFQETLRQDPLMHLLLTTHPTIDPVICVMVQERNRQNHGTTFDEDQAILDNPVTYLLIHLRILGYDAVMSRYATEFHLLTPTERTDFMERLTTVELTEFKKI